MSMIEIAHLIFVLFVGCAILFAFLRLIRGPSIADRINAADAIAISCVGLILAHGWLRGESLWLDVAMVAGLMLFVGTTAVALFIDPDTLASDEPTEGPGDAP